MKFRLREFANTPEKKRLIENFLSLSTLQFANYILPLITFPYLVRVLQPEKFGLLAFAMAVIQYFVIFTDYGFNLSATRDISVHRQDATKVSEIFSSVLIIKAIFVLAGFLILTGIILSIDKFGQEWLLYFFAYGVVTGQALFPVWFFQGMERMQYITILNVLAKGIFTILIFMFIRTSGDYVWVPVFNALGFITAGVLGIRIALKKFGIRWILPSRPIIKMQLRNGWYIFISSISVNFYKTLDILILGFFTSNAIVGYYAIAKKLVEVANQFAVVVSQSIYPQINTKIRQSYQATIIFLRKTALFIGSLTLTIGIVFFVLADWLIYLIGGEVFIESVISLKIIALVPFIVGINVPAVQLLLGSNLDKKYSFILISGVVLNFILNLILIPNYAFSGAAFATLISEMLITAGLYGAVFLNLNRIKILENHPHAVKKTNIPG